jgi:hypothetical protein
MELRINLEYKQILNLVHQLPEKDIERLASTLQSEVSNKRKRTKNRSIQELLLKAPTWTESDYSGFQEARDHINKSRIA